MNFRRRKKVWIFRRKRIRKLKNSVDFREDEAKGMKQWKYFQEEWEEAKNIKIKGRKRREREGEKEIMEGEGGKRKREGNEKERLEGE